MTEDDLKPEVGDTVVFNEHEYFDHIDGVYKPTCERGVIEAAYKNGNILVQPEIGHRPRKLKPSEFTVVAKAG